MAASRFCVFPNASLRTPASRMWHFALSPRCSNFQISRRSFAKSAMAYITTLETVDRCPGPSCPCAATPPDLDIDHKSPLDGTVATYDEHVIIRTGVNDWSSRIEDDARFPILRMFKQRLGRGGKFHDPFRNNLLSTSSSPTTSPSILLFPSFRAISDFPVTTATPDPSQLDSLIRGFLLPESPTTPPRAQLSLQPLNPPDDAAPATPAHPGPETLLRDPAAATALRSREIPHLTILICGHGGRDSRCGVLGPLLAAQFDEELFARRGWARADAADAAASSADGRAAAVEMISHVGGHKFAGNVIVYVPRAGAWVAHPLAGCGVWYGRVEPRHVEGIVEATVERGVVVRELFRGGVGGWRERLKLPS